MKTSFTKRAFTLFTALTLVLTGLTACTSDNGETKPAENENPEVITEEIKEMKTINDSFDKIYFLGDTDKNPLEYTAGEDMIFTVTLYGDGEVISTPYFRYEVTADDGSKKTGSVETENGSAEIKARCLVPGYARVKVYPADENKVIISANNISIFEGGACADFDKITQSKPEPADFDEFWASQRALIEEIPPEVIECVKVTEGAPVGFDVYDVKIKTVENSNPVSAYVSVPWNAKEGKCKLLVSYQGYGVASSAIITREGYICLHMNPHGIENGKEQSFYDNLKATVLSGFGFSNNNPPENSYFRNMLLRDIQGLRYLMTEYKDLWNGVDVEAEGGSMGAFQATAVASIMNDVVTKLTINIPWMCDLGSENHGRQNGWRPGFNEGLAYYDTANFAKRVKAPVTISAGLGDYICPPSGITVLYHSFNTEKTINFVQNRTHSYYPVKAITYTLKG